MMAALYDSQRVPVLGFHNPAATILYPKGSYSYSYGNTRGQDVTENLGTQKDQHLDVLLLASGDVRNLLFTVSGLSLRKPNERPKSISFHLNDYDPSIVARNAVVLEIANTIDPGEDDDVDFLWNVWYNLALSKDHSDRLRATLASLITRDFNECESFLKFQESKVLQECQAIWEDWKEVELDVDSVKEERKQLISEKSLSLEKFHVHVMQQIMMAPNVKSDFIKKSSPYYKEIKHWFEEGSTNDERHSVNPTLIRPFDHKWRVHYTACAFEGYLPLSRSDLIRCRSITGCCKETLRLLVKRFQQFKTATTFTVFFWTGDGLLLCTSRLPQGMRFDVIDTSNVADHIGLLNILVCCSPRLKRPLESQMFTSSMLWFKECENIMKYYSKCLGVNTYLLPTILGLKLAVDFDLGNRLPDDICSSQEIFCWVKTERTRTLLTLEEGDEVIQALFILVERCFDLVGLSKDKVFGPNLSSPLTLLRILQQLDPIVEGGAARILDLLRSKLPRDFEDKFGLSWNLINGSLGSIKEPIVEVNVKIDISTASWCTPIPMIIIFDDISKIPLKDPESNEFPPLNLKRRVIYNSLRYDDSKRVVTFHILEKDWYAIKDTSCLSIMSNTLQPTTIDSEPVCLGDEDVVSIVRRVDPVKTFGLDCVQTFDVRPKKQEHSALEVIKVEESECSYKAEIAILNPNKCKAKMDVQFYPEKCPTNINVKFEDGEECTIYFSCSVNEKSSKFQISRKQGKIVCVMPKREDGTVGERVIQNIAPVPFHALEIWDSGFDDTVIICGHMFGTELDMKLKSERKSGDAFFDLRESISKILQGHVEEPKIPKVYALEDNPLVRAPYNTLDDIKRKKGFIIKVEKIYRWNYLPLIKIIFYDCKKYGDIMKKNPTGSEALVRSFLSTIMRASILRTWADQKELDLLRKMLYTNAVRIPQEEVSADSLWKASFVTPLFPRERNNIFFQDTSSMQKSISKLLFGGITDTSQSAPKILAQALPRCHFCHKTSGDLKRCMGCKDVSYCSRDCQKKDWKQNHKAVCRKN
ncbi:uncharacterized protein LOC116306350 isoform X2 [Actinia tenebrosa]|uniref:Uncharacterized protein LOC116306350 isoform X2 n=1 Tax=Actinia tenebrosa TaxID=6105 RepID=A0A6P8IYK2_ACTTE|nr:uncharacterized protein LOC116306350 isoform X2 [Actinia tenebrosa]